MVKKSLVDYHFHPNLSKHNGRAIAKCIMIWKAFAEKNVAVAIITEHVFKNPSRAFHLMTKTRPTNATTVIFPGIEGLTKEGVDVICFAENVNIYDHQKLMVPKQLSVEEMVNYIKNHDGLFASIAHPYNPGHSGIVTRLGENESLRLMEKLGTIEVSNACFRGAKRFADATGFSKLMGQKRAMMDRTTYLPKTIYAPLKIKSFTGGSDAHVVVEIGSGLLVPISETSNRAEIFQAITHNQSTEFKQTEEKIYFWLGIHKLYSIVTEALTKAFRLYEGKIYQHDDQFTTFYTEAEKETVMILREQRGIILRPLLNFLTYFEVTPNVLNVISFITSLGSFLVVTRRPFLGIALFLTYLSVSSITGALARYQNTESESGAILKVARIYVALLAAMLAAIWFNWADPFWSALYLGLYTIMLWLIITLNQIGHPIRFVLRSKLIVIAAIFLYILTDMNYINYLVIGFSLYMAVMNTWMFFRLKRAS